MACGICNDATARSKTEFDDVPLGDLERSAKTCGICFILLTTLKECLHVGPKDGLSISNDTNIYHNRPTNGLHILVSKEGKNYTTDMFVLRNLRGKYLTYFCISTLKFNE